MAEHVARRGNVAEGGGMARVGTAPVLLSKMRHELFHSDNPMVPYQRVCIEGRSVVIVGV